MYTSYLYEYVTYLYITQKQYKRFCDRWYHSRQLIWAVNCMPRRAVLQSKIYALKLEWIAISKKTIYSATRIARFFQKISFINTKYGHDFSCLGAASISVERKPSSLPLNSISWHGFKTHGRPWLLLMLLVWWLNSAKSFQLEIQKQHTVFF